MPPKKRTRGPRVRHEPSKSPEPMEQDEPEPMEPEITIAVDVPEAIAEIKIEAEESEEEQVEEVNYDHMVDADNFENDVREPRPQYSSDDDDLESIDADAMNGPEDLERRKRRREAKNRKSLDASVKMMTIREGMTREEKNLIASAKSIKKGIVDAMNDIFMSRAVSNQDFIAGSQKIITAFKKANNNKDQRWNLLDMFYIECDARLSYIMEEVSVPDHRARIFKLYAIVATELKILNFGDAFFHWLIKYLQIWEDSDNLAARTNVSCFISYIFETGKSRLDQADKFCGFDLDDSCTLFFILKKALLDREYTARVPAIKGMGVLQSLSIPSGWPDEAREQSPRELLIRSCRDCSWECRLVAMQSIKPNENDVRLICDVAYFDRSNVVRCAALEQMGKLKPNKFVRDKVHLLDTCFKDHASTVRDAAKQVLKTWVERLSDKWSDKQKGRRDNEVLELRNGTEQVPADDSRMKGYFLSGQALSLLWLSDVPETTESHNNLRRMITHTLDVIRQMYLCHVEPVNTFADVIIGDLRENMLQSAIPILTKSTIASLLEDSEVVQCHDAGTNRAMIFYWRCVLDYCSDRKRNEADKINALTRFISPLMTMVEHLDRLLIRIKGEEFRPNYHGVENFQDDVYVVQMSMVENMLCAMRHAPSDPSGQEAYKKTLIGLLMNPFYQKKVMDVIVQELAPFYKDCPDDLFSLFYARVNEMRQKYKGKEFASLEGAVFVGESKYRVDWERARMRDPAITEREQGEHLINYYELKMLNSLMKTGILEGGDGWNDEYEARYGRMLRRTVALGEEDLDAGIMAYECLGMVGMYDINYIRHDIPVWIDKQFDGRSEVLQGAIITVFAELYIKDSAELDEIIGLTERRSLIVLLCEIIIQVPLKTNSLTLLSCVEASIRIVLNATYKIVDDQEWQRVIVTLMYRSSFRLCNMFTAKIRSMIVVALKFFCSISRQNQMLLVKSFRRFFDLYTSTSNVDLFTEARNDILPKLRRCAAAFVTLTRHSLLNSDKEMKKMPAQVTLMDDILQEVGGNPNSSAVDFYLCALVHIEFESFPRDALNKIYGDLTDYIVVHEYDEDRTRYNELRRVAKKVAGILGLNLNDDELTEMAAQSKAARGGNAAKRGRGGRKASTRAGSVRASERGSEIPRADSVEQSVERILEDVGEEDDVDKGIYKKRISTIPEADEELSEDGDDDGDDEDDDDDEEEEADVPSTSAGPPPARRAPPRVRGTLAASTSKPKKDALELMQSPVRNPRKPPSRQNSTSRPTPTPSTRSGPSRSARRLLRSDNK